MAAKKSAAKKSAAKRSSTSSATAGDHPVKSSAIDNGRARRPRTKNPAEPATHGDLVAYGLIDDATGDE